MEKKVVLIVLILIALAAVIFLGVGLARDKRDGDFDTAHYEPGTLYKKMDGLFSRSRKPFDIRRMPAQRMTGCTIAGRVLTFNAQCDLAIDSSKTKSSEFKLTNLSGGMLGAYAFSREELDDMWADPKKRSRLDPDRVPRFVVTKDGAFLRLLCTTGTAGACRVTVE